MKKRKWLSGILILCMLLLMIEPCFAEESHANQVHVIVENTTFTPESDYSEYWDDNKFWDGTLVDEWVPINSTSTMMTCVANIVRQKGFTIIGEENNYISSINGLGEFDAGEGSGWMVTLNDWFINAGMANFGVANGYLEAGDEIRMMYTCDLGYDLGCSVSSGGASLLKTISFEDENNKAVGSLTPNFNPESATDVFPKYASYTLILNEKQNGVYVLPEAMYKGYQVRMYHYTPSQAPSSVKSIDFTQKGFKKSQLLEVNNGDVIYIMCGEKKWPSMATSDGGHLYRIQIKKGNQELLMGDANGDGSVKINDAVAIQKHIIGLKKLSDVMALQADFNGDGFVTIQDAVKIQKKVIGIK